MTRTELRVAGRTHDTLFHLHVERAKVEEKLAEGRKQSRRECGWNCCCRELLVRAGKGEVMVHFSIHARPPAHHLSLR